jgi:chromatin segregation and condensation protein Rec8/ScpA/Scc1 (kleisin family)
VKVSNNITDDKQSILVNSPSTEELNKNDDKLENYNHHKSQIQKISKIGNQSNKTFNNQSETFQDNYKSLIKAKYGKECSNSIKKLYTSQKSAELNLLIDETKLGKVIKKNPWEINIEKTLSNFNKRIYENSEMKFRIGGRIIYSASQIVRAKSNLVIRDSFETQDELNIREIEVDDTDYDELDNDDYLDEENCENGVEQELSISNNSQDNGTNSMTSKINLNLQPLNMNKNSVFQLNSETLLEPDYSTYPFFSEDEKGERYLPSPVRSVYQKISIADLGKSLEKTLKYKILKPDFEKGRKILTRSDALKVLPESIIKKAEQERAKVELQINNMYQKILERKVDKEPVPFISLLISPNREGIVQTLLYLLHLVNRKKIEIFQKIDFDEEQSPKKSIGIKIFISPYLIEA